MEEKDEKFLNDVSGGWSLVKIENINDQDVYYYNLDKNEKDKLESRGYFVQASDLSVYDGSDRNPLSYLVVTNEYDDYIDDTEMRRILGPSKRFL